MNEELERPRMDVLGGVSGRMTARLVRLLERHGHDPSGACRRAGVSVEEVVNPSARIPYKSADVLVEACVDLVGRALSALPKTVSLAARVRALCDADPDALGLGVADIAARLHMASRTLQRRLSAEGTSWADLVDEIREKRASSLALRGASDKEIAFLVGFSDPSALSRARLRWTRRLRA